MTVTRADTDLLEGYSDYTVAAVARVRGSVDGYHLALARLGAAETDLAVGVDDHSPLVRMTLDELDRFDRGPARFAAVLRATDHLAAGFDAAAGMAVTTIDHVTRLVTTANDGAEAAQRVSAYKALASARWDRMKLEVRQGLHLRWARLRSVPARLWYGPGSPQAAARVDAVRARFGPLIADTHARTTKALGIIADPPGLPSVGRVAGKVGLVGGIWAVAAGSPYEGTRGRIDHGVSIASLAASGAMVAAGFIGAPAVAAAVTAVAGVVLVGAAAWTIGNLAKDAWDNRKVIARSIADAGAAVTAAGRGVVRTVGAALAGAT